MHLYYIMLSFVHVFMHCFINSQFQFRMFKPSFFFVQFCRIIISVLPHTCIFFKVEGSFVLYHVTCIALILQVLHGKVSQFEYSW